MYVVCWPRKTRVWKVKVYEHSILNLEYKHVTYLFCWREGRSKKMNRGGWFNDEVKATCKYLGKWMKEGTNDSLTDQWLPMALIKCRSEWMTEGYLTQKKPEKKRQTEKNVRKRVIQITVSSRALLRLSTNLLGFYYSLTPRPSDLVKIAKSRASSHKKCLKMTQLEGNETSPGTDIKI